MTAEMVTRSVTLLTILIAIAGMLYLARVF